jgi:hypothetical protein
MELISSMAGRVAPRAPHLEYTAKAWLFVDGKRRARSDAPYQFYL